MLTVLSATGNRANAKICGMSRRLAASRLVMAVDNIVARDKPLGYYFGNSASRSFAIVRDTQRQCEQRNMGAFIGYDDVGVWATNRERDAFLDWFADNRCTTGDTHWNYCKSEAQRWTGRCIELEDLNPNGEHLNLTGEEYSQAAITFWPHVAQLLGIIDSMTRGDWQIRVDSKSAVNWRRD